jgi:uncharacterized membrane protein YcjF (UPF0283 family)
MDNADVRYAKKADEYFVGSSLVGTLLAGIGVVFVSFAAVSKWWYLVPVLVWVGFLFLMAGTSFKYDEALSNLRSVLNQREDALRHAEAKDLCMRTVLEVFRADQILVDEKLLQAAKIVERAYQLREFHEVQRDEKNYQDLVALAEKEGYKVWRSWKKCLEENAVS